MLLGFIRRPCINPNVLVPSILPRGRGEKIGKRRKIDDPPVSF
jgi:hypothetical protein